MYVCMIKIYKLLFVCESFAMAALQKLNLIEGPKSIFEIKIAISKLKFSFSIANSVTGFQPNVP